MYLDVFSSAFCVSPAPLFSTHPAPPPHMSQALELFTSLWWKFVPLLLVELLATLEGVWAADTSQIDVRCWLQRI